MRDIPRYPDGKTYCLYRASVKSGVEKLDVLCRRNGWIYVTDQKTGEIHKLPDSNIMLTARSAQNTLNLLLRYSMRMKNLPKEAKSPKAVFEIHGRELKVWEDYISCKEITKAQAAQQCNFRKDDGEIIIDKIYRVINSLKMLKGLKKTSLQETRKEKFTLRIFGSVTVDDLMTLQEKEAQRLSGEDLYKIKLIADEIEKNTPVEFLVKDFFVNGSTDTVSKIQARLLKLRKERSWLEVAEEMQRSYGTVINHFVNAKRRIINQKAIDVFKSFQSS